MRIFEIENKNQLIKSFIVGLLWTGWIYLWFFHTRFISFFNQSSNFFENAIWGPHYILSVFTLYSILYLPRNCHNTKLSIIYLLEICFLQSINLFAIMIDITTFEEYLLPNIFILILNFIIVWKAKYVQLNLWERFKSTITLTVKNEVFIKENQIKLYIFVFSGVILLNLSGFFLGDQNAYFFIPMTQIVFSAGYFIYVSENRKWMDRIYDFLTLLVLNFFNLMLKYGIWTYLKDNFYFDTPIFLLVLLLEFFQIYIYYSFSSRTFLADFALNLHKKPTEFKELSRKPIEKEQICCPKCGTVIEQLDSSINKENSTIFCPFCGEKIMRYELLDISEAELLIKHQKVLQQLDQKNEPRSYLP